MKPNDIILTDKITDILNDESRFILLEGSTGVGKSFIGGLKTFFRIFQSPKGYDTYAIVAESQITAEKMFIDDVSSFYNIFKDLCEYKSGRKPHILIKGKYSEKKVYLGGFATKKDYQKILGLNLYGIHIEEISIANDEFIKEAFTRVSRLNSSPWLFATTNGGLPNQMFYKDFFDRSYIDKKYIDKIPKQKLDLMKDVIKDDRFKYWHWRLEDSPVMGEKQIRELYSLHPVGSFYYNSKILGIPGYVDGLMYNIKDINIIRDFNSQNYKRYITVCDIGESSSSTVFLLAAPYFNTDLNQMELHILKSYWHLNDDVNDIQKKSQLEYIKDYVKFIQESIDIFKIHPEKILFDGTDAFFRDLQKELRSNQLGQHIPKRVSKEEIKDRIYKGQTWLHLGKLRFHSSCEKVIQDFSSAIYDKKKMENSGKIDRKEDYTEIGHNDGIDATEYSMTYYDRVII